MSKAYFWKVYLITLLTILLSNCNTDAPSRITRINDFFGEEVIPLQIRYDHKDRPISLGETPISYSGNLVEIGEIDNLPGYGHIYGIVYQMKNDKVIYCEANLDEKFSEGWRKVTKKSSYTYTDNIITIKSTSYAPGSNELLKTYLEIREYDKDGRLNKATVKDNSPISGTYCYRYNSNIRYEANLNLQAYTYCTNGADDMLAYLLNLYDVRNPYSLPSEMTFEGVNGKIHQMTDNYIFDGDRITRLDVIQDYEMLSAKITLEYE